MLVIHNGAAPHRCRFRNFHLLRHHRPWSDAVLFLRVLQSLAIDMAFITAVLKGLPDLVRGCLSPLPNLQSDWIVYSALTRIRQR